MTDIFFSIFKLLLIILLGFGVYRRGLLKEASLEFLTRFVIYITVPSLIFSTIITNFRPQSMPPLWVFLLISTLLFAAGVLFAVLTSVKTGTQHKKEFIALVGFQNAGYLPMNIAAFLFAPAQREIFLTYIFLYLLGFNIFMWSAGSYLILRKGHEGFKAKSLITPPVASTALALIAVYTGIHAYIPEVIITPIAMVGETSFVLSMVILGAWLAKAGTLTKTGSSLIIRLIAAKLLLLPLTVYFILTKIDIYPLLGFFILLESCMPSAASLPIVAQMHGADSRFMSKGVLFTHIASIITVPLWMGLYMNLNGMYR